MKKYNFLRKFLIARNAKKQAPIYMARKDVLHCLHLGCGSNLLPGWLNTDILVPVKGEKIYLDATNLIRLQIKVSTIFFQSICSNIFRCKMPCICCRNVKEY